MKIILKYTFKKLTETRKIYSCVPHVVLHLLGHGLFSAPSHASIHRLNCNVIRHLYDHLFIGTITHTDKHQQQTTNAEISGGDDDVVLSDNDSD